LTAAPITLLCDTREPEPHPWQRWMPAHVTLERATLDTGDLALAGLPDAAVVERKTVADFLGCMTSNRDRFERELARSRYVGRFAVVVEGTLLDCLRNRGGLSEPSLIGTVAAWSRRYCPILFAGTERHAAELAFRFLAGQITEAHRIIRATASDTTESNPSKAGRHERENNNN
jgi:ERCC4-type nuclease